LNKYENGISYEQIRLSEPYTYFADGVPVFYAFQTNPGFIIISAEDAFTPVIGYSYEGRFDMANAPENYKAFLLSYAEQINYARVNQIEPSAEFSQQWEEFSTDNVSSLNVTREKDVDPLLSILWNQDSPYNIMCPEDPAGPGGHTYVGCVGTAMAMIMGYWRYPEVGTGQHCYWPPNTSYGQQCANFGETHYNWSGMINGIDNKNPYPNAELQYHCAVSVNMDFSPDGSGAYSYNVPGSLSAFFQYPYAQYKERQNYTTDGWISLLKGDIDLGYPVYYSGYTPPPTAGHAFVCDGYQGSLYHFNFGWSGSGNGFYALSDVGGFYVSQACVRKFYPNMSNYPYYNTETITLTEKSGSLVDGSGPINNYLDDNTAYWLIDPQNQYDSITRITLFFSQFDVMEGDVVNVYDGGTTSDPLIGTYSGTANPPAINSTGNKLLVEFITDSEGNASGWYAEYSTVSPVWCTGLVQFTEPTGTFDDGSGDFYYQGGATCMWRIKPPYANTITLNFNYFETEEGQDKLKVFDGSVQIGEFSGNQIPDAIEATSGTMFITWSTSSAINMQGWEAYFSVDNVGIHEEAAVKDLEVYPNPASENIHVSFQVEKESSVMIRLVTLTGQVVYAEEHKEFSGIYNQEVNVSALTAGMYFMEIKTSTGTSSKKIMIR
jgi:hypothetical protein